MAMDDWDHLNSTHFTIPHNISMCRALPLSCLFSHFFPIILGFSPFLLHQGTPRLHFILYLNSSQAGNWILSICCQALFIVHMSSEPGLFIHDWFSKLGCQSLLMLCLAVNPVKYLVWALRQLPSVFCLTGLSEFILNSDTIMDFSMTLDDWVWRVFGMWMFGFGLSVWG